MPCVKKTVPVPTASFNSPTIDSSSVSDNAFELTYSVKNDGDASGTHTAKVVVDVGVTGTYDKTERFDLEIDAGKKKSNTVEFSFDFNSATEVNVCVVDDGTPIENL